MIETEFKKPLTFLKKEIMVKNDEVVRVPKDKVIKTLKILEGLKRTLLESIKHA